MEYISSKNIFLLLRDTLKLIDRRPMNHGSRVGYLLCKMLECKGGYEQYELADFLMLATLHDIGVYKTENINNKLKYEFKDILPHSVYGFLFLRNITPLDDDKSRMILYHRVPFKQIQGAHYDFFQETTLLTLAEAAEIYHFALGSYKFDYNMFRRQEGTFYTTQALDLLETCVREHNVFEHLSDESYQQEIDGILEYMIFTNEEKKKYMETLMYCIGFKSEIEVVNAVSSLCISQNLAQKLGLSEEDSEKLYYAALIHDIGMLSISSDIIEAARKLTDDEIKLMRTHVEREEKILLNRMDPEVVKIATAHHERCDGSGYPKGLKEEEMNTEQFILQIADVVTGLSCDRTYRKAFEKDQIIEILNDEMARNKLNKNITKVFIDSYDEIMPMAKEEAKKTLEMYNVLGLKYEAVKAKLSGGS